MEPDEVLEPFTDGARTVLTRASEEARLLNHSFVGTEHILLGFIHEGEEVAAKVIEAELEACGWQRGNTLEFVRNKVIETVGRAGTAPSGAKPFTPRANKVLELSLRESHKLGHSYIGTKHLLLGIVRDGENLAATVLVRLGADLVDLRERTLRLMSGGP